MKIKSMHFEDIVKEMKSFVEERASNKMEVKGEIG